MHIGILTGGGDCPGLNAVIRAATLELLHAGVRVTGIERGFLGLMRNRMRPLQVADVDDILDQGGTILGTHNRADPFHDFALGGADVSAQVLACARQAGLDGVLAIGGDGTMDIAARLHALGLPMIGVPKTIDNDIALTERTFGFDSAVAIVTEALGRLRTTARSHGRVMIVETMGRYAGWIALEQIAGIGADVVGLDWTVNLGAARALVGDRVALQGNLDPNVLFAPPEAVAREARAVLDSFGRPQRADGTWDGHIFNLGHGISQFTPPEHVTALVQTVHEHSRTLR